MTKLREYAWINTWYKKNIYIISVFRASLSLLKSILFYPEQQNQNEQLWKHSITS